MPQFGGLHPKKKEYIRKVAGTGHCKKTSALKSLTSYLSFMIILGKFRLHDVPIHHKS